MALRAHKPQPAKTAAIENITNELKAASSFIFTEYRGLSVEQITQLRAIILHASLSIPLIWTLKTIWSVLLRLQ